MKRHVSPAIFIVAIVTALVAASCNAIGPTTIGSGNARTEQRTVDSFTKVRVGEAIKATITVGTEVTVFVTTDDNVLGNVTTNVIAGTLTLGMTGSAQPRVPVSVAITMPDLEEVTASSASNVIATGVNHDSFTATADSAATLVVRGNADEVNVTASSAATADLGDVPAQSASVRVGSAARATVNAQISVTGNVDSGGVVTVEGDPPNVNVATNSGGAVIRD